MREFGAFGRSVGEQIIIAAGGVVNCDTAMVVVEEKMHQAQSA